METIDKIEAHVEWLCGLGFKPYEPPPIRIVLIGGAATPAASTSYLREQNHTYEYGTPLFLPIGISDNPLVLAWFFDDERKFILRPATALVIGRLRDRGFTEVQFPL